MLSSRCFICNRYLDEDVSAIVSTNLRGICCYCYTAIVHHARDCERCDLASDLDLHNCRVCVAENGSCVTYDRLLAIKGLKLLELSRDLRAKIAQKYEEFVNKNGSM